MQTTLTVIAIVGLSLSPLFAQSQFDFEWEPMAERIVVQLAPKPGEKILLVARPGNFDALIPHLRYALMKAGAVDLGVIDVIAEPYPKSWEQHILRQGAGQSRASYRELLRNFDGAIMLPGARPDHSIYAALQDLLRDGRGRTIHFHWTQNGSAFPIPGQLLPPEHVIDATYQRALLETDYVALANVQRRFAAAIRKAEIRVTSPTGTDIRFRVGDRPVNFQDGDASAARANKGVVLIDREIELPAGAIRVAPIEETVHGTISFPTSRWNDRTVEGLKLRLEAGQITEVTASLGQEAVAEELANVSETAQAFREFALGFNSLLAVPENDQWIPYYGYGSGVVRLSLGDNSELGGTVTGGYVRWNFFTDATVTIGHEVWVRDGRLTVPVP